VKTNNRQLPRHPFNGPELAVALHGPALADWELAEYAKMSSLATLHAGIQKLARGKKILRMPNVTRKGSLHLSRLAGIDLFLHWSWFFAAAFEIGDRAKTYSSLTWNVLEYLALFRIRRHS
jgi:hypothetical protein